MKTLVIIPAFNEEKNITGVIQKIKNNFLNLDVLVVDDGSKDQTVRFALESGVLVAKHPFNMGYGVALQTGYKYACKHGYDAIVQIDADGQHDPKYIGDLLREIENGSADIVIGSRFISGIKYEAGFIRKTGMFLFGRLVSFIIGQAITDSTSGFQALSSKAFKFLTKDIYPLDYPDADVIIMFHKAGFKIKEVPLIMYRKDGSKSMHSGLKPVYYVFKMTLSIFLMFLRKSPVKKGGN